MMQNGSSFQQHARLSFARLEHVLCTCCLHSDQTPKSCVCRAVTVCVQTHNYNGYTHARRLSHFNYMCVCVYTQRSFSQTVAEPVSLCARKPDVKIAYNKNQGKNSCFPEIFFYHLNRQVLTLYVAVSSQYSGSKLRY